MKALDESNIKAMREALRLGYIKPTAEQQTILNIAEQRDELLEALQRLIDCYSTSNSPDTRMSCWDQAKAAIAKATAQ